MWGDGIIIKVGKVYIFTRPVNLRDISLYASAGTV
jgi:predicted transcriptional regulator